MGRSGDPRKRDQPKSVQTLSEGGTIYICSAQDPDAPTECLLSWQGQDWRATVKEVRTTAVDLFTVAAWADMMMFLMGKLDLPPGVMTAMMSDLLGEIVRREGRKGFGASATFSLTPVGSSKAGRGLVLLERRKQQVVLETEEARTMGLHWLEIAEASESDQLLTETLRTAGQMDAQRIEGVFAYLRELRK